MHDETLTNLRIGIKATNVMLIKKVLYPRKRFFVITQVYDQHPRMTCNERDLEKRPIDRTLIANIFVQA